MDNQSLAWEPYQVKTEDGWFLTIFRITGEVDSEPNYLKDENKEKLPVVMQHASFQDLNFYVEGGYAALFVDLGLINPTLPLALVGQGYDVWAVSSRGFTYNNKHERDGEWSLEERWDFSWADVGEYDLPAIVDKVLEVTGKPKVTLTGYSQGSSSMLYGLAKKQDFFAERVNRFIGLAPCLIPDADPLPNYLENARNLKIQELGVLHFGIEEDEGQANSDEICEFIGGRLCGYSNFEPSGQNMGSLNYYANIYTSRRFQEPQSVDDMVREKLTPLVDLGNIDRVPVSLVVFTADTTCPAHQAEFIYSQIKSENSYFRYENGMHITAFWYGTDTFITHMVETIETGTSVDSANVIAIVTLPFIVTMVLGGVF